MLISPHVNHAVSFEALKLNMADKLGQGRSFVSAVSDIASEQC